MYATSFGGSGDDYAQAVAMDSRGHVFVSGGFSSPTAKCGSTTIVNTGGVDIFIVAVVSVSEAFHV